MHTIGAQTARKIAGGPDLEQLKKCAASFRIPNFKFSPHTGHSALTGRSLSDAGRGMFPIAQQEDAFPFSGIVERMENADLIHPARGVQCIE